MTRIETTKIKTLTAVIILSAAVATPVAAQEGKRAPANGYSLVSQTNARGAYNQVSVPSYNAKGMRDRFSPENSGTVDKDPQITGGEDITRRATAN